MVSIRYRPPGAGADDVPQTPSDQAVVPHGRARIPTEHGSFVATAYTDSAGLEHLAYVSDTTAELDTAPLVRLHSECLTGDALGSQRCDCGSQLRAALALTGDHGGIVLYIRGHEGRVIGLGQKMLAYELQDAGLDTVDANHALGHPADARSYDVAAAILHDLGVTRIRLLSNNPAKIDGLAALGIEVTELHAPIAPGAGHPDRVAVDRRATLELAAKLCTLANAGALELEAAFSGYPHLHEATRARVAKEIAACARAHAPDGIGDRRLLVGDGVSDLAAACEVDLFVAFAGVVARPAVVEAAPVVITAPTLAPILALALGPAQVVDLLLGGPHDEVARTCLQAIDDGSIEFNDEQLGQRFAASLS